MSRELVGDAALLVKMAEEVRGKTLKIFDAAKDSELLWTPPGLSNHVLWHAGHSFWVTDFLAYEAATGRSELPDGWYEAFSNKCTPVSERTDWPSRSEVRQRLVDQLPRLTEALRGLSRAELEGPPKTPKLPSERTLWYCILHGLHDEALHGGEMHLLLKMQRKGG